MVNVDLDSLSPYPTTDEVIQITILEEYESMPCKENSLNANVYKVKLIRSNETIYVFEVCEEMIWTIDKVSNASQDIYPFVVLVSKNKESNFNISSMAKIPLGSEYLFGSIKMVEY